jgi:cell wall-associated NlpC family hydrolase
MRPLRFVLPALAILALAGTAQAATNDGSGGAGMGGSGTQSPPSGGGTPAPGPTVSTTSHPTVAGNVGKIRKGVAYAPANAPLKVKQIIWAGDKIRHKPYIYGGGHGVWKAAGYDCSGSVSYVLHAAKLLKVSEDSGQMESWGRRGKGHWVTVYTNAGHAFIEVAGIRLDTSAEGDPHPPAGSGPRWRPLLHPTTGFMARHPKGY